MFFLSYLMCSPHAYWRGGGGGGIVTVSAPLSPLCFSFVHCMQSALHIVIQPSYLLKFFVAGWSCILHRKGRGVLLVSAHFCGNIDALNAFHQLDIKSCTLLRGQ